MKHIPSDGFNKEKLIFLGTAVVLSLTLYHLMVSAPVELQPSAAVSPLPPPGPLDREKPDTRVANVEFYLQSGGLSPQTGLAVDRNRKNPFEPIENDFRPDLNVNVAAPAPKPAGNKPPQSIIEPPPAPNPIDDVAKPEKKKDFDPSDKIAKVDFSGVMTMNNMTYGLLKSKDGQTIQVKEGDYLEDYKYTVSKIEKQAIWVTDDDNQLFIARDLTFDGGSGGADPADDKAPKKRPSKKTGTQNLVASANPAPAPTPLAAPQANTNQRGGNTNQQRPQGNKGGKNGGQPKGGF